MAGDWLKFEKTTLDKPEVFEMAGILGIDPDAVIGKLLRVWDWFDDQSTDGYAPVALAAQLNRNTGCSEFTAAMQKVGWLIIDGEKLSIPNFHRHNGQTAKDRALSAKRMAKSRGKSYADTVTSTATQPQPEKRREEKRRDLPTVDPPLPPKGELVELAKAIWENCPKLGRERSSKVKLLEALKKLPKKDLPDITIATAAILAWCASESWSKDGGQFVCGIHIWVKNRQWETIPEPAKPRRAGNACELQEDLEIPIL